MKRTPLARKTPLKRSSLSRGKGPSLRRTPLRKVNAERMARRRKAYAERFRRPDWKVLRYAAFERSGGLCECPFCVAVRAHRIPTMEVGWYAPPEDAFRPVEVWFVKSGKSVADRFRGGSTHHKTYARMGHELLSDLLFMHPHHHAAVEAEHGTRRHYLGGK